MAVTRAVPVTLLSLDRYSKIMGINPAHFWGASAINLNPVVFPIVANCDSLWFQYSWQDSDRVARYDIAVAIKTAEEDIARLLGYWPAPQWISQERRQYPRPYRREYFGYGYDVRWQWKPVNARWGRIVSPGGRAVSLVGTATTAGGTLVYTDEDTDGLFETATITLPTTLTDACEIKLFHAGHSGVKEWEIRDIREKYISGGNVVIIVDSWLLIDPELYPLPPTEMGAMVVDISTVANFVISVDVYREYIDPTVASATLYWEPSYVVCQADEDACDPVTQDACLRVRNEDGGIFVPVPSSYDATSGTWVAQAFSGGREPDYLRMNYLAGYQDEGYLAGDTCDPLSDFWAQTIAWLATARLERGVCDCGNINALFDRLRMDIAKNTAEASFLVDLDMLGNPLGTRLGEMIAWRRISQVAEKRMNVALV